MRVLALSVLPLLAACDPAALATFDIRPQPDRPIDSSFVSEASRIGRDFAQRYQLTPMHRQECPGGGYYADDTARGRHVGLNLCLGPIGQIPIEKQFRFSVEEIITFYWGPKGAALRDELEDTLKARYGDAVKADITRR